MKPIFPQNSGGYRLALAHQHPPTTKDEARSRWGNFGDKAIVQAQLLKDQYGLCCYSELRADLEGLGYHIEHIRPKSQFPRQTFDYTNLAASALSSDDLNTIKPDAFGGHAKRSQFDPSFISCHNPNCASYFAYLSDGRIVAKSNLSAADKNRANYTITLLNLNSPYLTNRRRRWYDELDQFYEEHLAKNWSLSDLAACDLIPSQQGLSPFFSLTRQFFGPIAEQALQKHAPQLV